MSTQIKSLTRILTKSSLFFLLVGNLIGLLLSILLAFPDTNFLLPEVNFGRLVPVHLNFQLYGWSAIPLIGLILNLFLDKNQWIHRTASLPVFIWSLSLCIGAISWVLGYSSGKLFLEWQGFAKYVFLFNLGILWCFTAYSYFLGQFKEDTKGAKILKVVLIAILSSIPFIFYQALSPNLFPPINKISSGATGSSLLLSTLAVIFIMLILPLILKVTRVRAINTYFVFIFFFLHAFLSKYINLSHSTNFDKDQIIGLSSLIIWIPLIYLYYRDFKFHKCSRQWLLSCLFWGTILTLTAIYMFLPPQLIVAKFSSYLVTHVHLAMGGFISSLCMIILTSLPNTNSHLGDKKLFSLWHIGLLMHFTSTIILGYLEYQTSGILYHYPGSLADGVQYDYILRIIAGTILTYCPMKWLFKGTYV